MNYVGKTLAVLILGATLVGLGCSSGPKPTNVSSESRYQTDGKIYKNKISGTTKRDVDDLNDDVFNQWMAANGRNIRDDSIGSHISKMLGYRSELDNLEKDVYKLVSGDTKTSLLKQILNAKEDVNKYLALFIGESRVTSKIELDGNLSTSVDGSSKLDPGVEITKNAEKYFSTGDATKADAYRTTVMKKLVEKENTTANTVETIRKAKDAKAPEIKKQK